MFSRRLFPAEQGRKEFQQGAMRTSITLQDSGFELLWGRSGKQRSRKKKGVGFEKLERS